MRLVEIKTPAGTPGLANVTLSANGASDTAARGFQFVQNSKVFPFSTSPSFLLYDSFRQKLYAAHKDQVEVIDPIAQQVPDTPYSRIWTIGEFAIRWTVTLPRWEPPIHRQRRSQSDPCA